MAYTDGLGQEEFIANDLTYDATLRNLELIGEAATRIPMWDGQVYAGSPTCSRNAGFSTRSLEMSMVSTYANLCFSQPGKLK
nr:HepT-like ribonuclease domain-containing protein [uncultured Halomonas sp.]